MVTRDQLVDDFAARVRDELVAQGKDPDVKPTQRWLRKHDFWEVFTYCRGRDETVDTLLVNELGFDERPSKPLPGHSTETKQQLHAFFRDETNVFNRVDNSSIADLSTHMRTLMDICRDVHGHADLLKIARMERREQFIVLRDLFEALEDHHETEGAAYNYACTLIEFFDWLDLNGEIETHLAAELRDRFDWEYRRDGPAYVLTPAEVRQLWRATESLDEKVIIVLLFGAGLRPNDIQVLTESTLYLTPDDPHIEFDFERKNGPGSPVLLAGIDILKRRLELLKQGPDWNGHILPSDQSKSGSRSYTYIRARFDDVVDRSGLEIDRDDYELTPTAGRDFYMNILAEARLQYLHDVSEPVTDAAGSSSERVLNKHYLRNRKNRRFFHKYARSHFEAAFGDHAVSPLEETSQTEVSESQTRIKDWYSDESAQSHLRLSDIGRIIHSGTNHVDKQIVTRLPSAPLSQPASPENPSHRAAVSVVGLTLLASTIAVTLSVSAFSLSNSLLTLLSGVWIGLTSLPH